MIIRHALFNATLRHKVLLQKPVVVSDDAGGYTTTWETLATLWASIDRVQGGERYTHGQITASATHLFRMRYNRLILPEMRLVFGDRIFNIRHIHTLDERKHLMSVYAEEGVAQ
jgi:SPP1 family predicted phage head-tail adaptor